MIYAVAVNGSERIYAQPDRRGQCPGCHASLRPKCGEIKVWHWSHIHVADCDPWSEGESAWHLAWKARVPSACCEVTMGTHRADIVTAKHIIELQHSSISPAEIHEREAFYGPRLVWFPCRRGPRPIYGHDAKMTLREAAADG